MSLLAHSGRDWSTVREAWLDFGGQLVRDRMPPSSWGAGTRPHCTPMEELQGCQSVGLQLGLSPGGSTQQKSGLQTWVVSWGSLLA